MLTPTMDELDLEFIANALTVEHEALAGLVTVPKSALYRTCRAKATDRSVPLRARLAYLSGRALDIREAFAWEVRRPEVSSSLATIWLSSHGVAWEETDGIHRLHPDAGAMGVIFYFSVMGSEPELYRASLAELRDHANTRTREFLDHLVKICRLEHDAVPPARPP